MTKALAVTINHVVRWCNTVRHLTLIQLLYQIKYHFIKPSRVYRACSQEIKVINIYPFPYKNSSIVEEDGVIYFNFLNQQVARDILVPTWTYNANGLLWSYNLNYFDCLHQQDMTKAEGLHLLHTYYSQPDTINPILLHPYPTSLRIINIAKFISRFEINERWLTSELTADISFLKSRIEYHLQGNHLLENAFALFIGGLVAQQPKLATQGRDLIKKQLLEQVLDDGMHYERSPMYHLIILERILDVLNYAINCNDEIRDDLITVAHRMVAVVLHWNELQRIPMMQDSAYGIALPTADLLQYAKRLLGAQYPTTPASLKDSRYRFLSSGPLKVFANVGAISPSYQPGHAHADELSFELFLDGIPVIVDTGVSTYEKNDRRQTERSSQSHNCVFVGTNSSDVWSGFRVGSRAQVRLMVDSPDIVEASCSFNKKKIVRRFDVSVPNKLVISDTLKDTSHKQFSGKGHLHFHPNRRLDVLTSSVMVIDKKLRLSITNRNESNAKMTIGSYDYAMGYNRLVNAKRVSYDVTDNVRIAIEYVN